MTLSQERWLISQMLGEELKATGWNVEQKPIWWNFTDLISKPEPGMPHCPWVLLCVSTFHAGSPAGEGNTSLVTGYWKSSAFISGSWQCRGMIHLKGAEGIALQKWSLKTDYFLSLTPCQGLDTSNIWDVMEPQITGCLESPWAYQRIACLTLVQFLLHAVNFWRLWYALSLICQDWTLTRCLTWWKSRMLYWIL